MVSELQNLGLNLLRKSVNISIMILSNGLLIVVNINQLRFISKLYVVDQTELITSEACDLVLFH
jgi:hypothetical protein